MRPRLRTVAALFSFALLGAGLFGCDQGGTTDPVTAEEARSRITESAAPLQQASTALDGTPLGAMSGMMAGSEGGSPNGSGWGSDLLSGLGAVLDTTGGTFNYDASTGVYAWTEAEQAWEQTRPADSLILRFPATPEARRNNATFVLGEYDTRSLPVGAPEDRLPTRIDASLSVNGTEAFNIDLRDVEVSPLLGIPQSFTLEVALPPLAYSADLHSPSGAPYRYQDRLENDGALVTATDATAEVLSGEAEDENPLGEVQGTTQVGQDLAVEYTAQIGALAALSDASAADVNENAEVRVLHQGTQVATLRYDATAEQVLVVYPDGETEPLADLLRDLGL